jgi:hypothetical protein
VTPLIETTGLLPDPPDGSWEGDGTMDEFPGVTG